MAVSPQLIILRTLIAGLPETPINLMNWYECFAGQYMKHSGTAELYHRHEDGLPMDMDERKGYAALAHYFQITYFHACRLFDCDQYQPTGQWKRGRGIYIVEASKYEFLRRLDAVIRFHVRKDGRNQAAKAEQSVDN